MERSQDNSENITEVGISLIKKVRDLDVNSVNDEGASIVNKAFVEILHTKKRESVDSDMPKFEEGAYLIFNPCASPDECLFWLSAEYPESIREYGEDRNISPNQFHIWAKPHYEIHNTGQVFAYVDEEGETQYMKFDYQ